MLPLCRDGRNIELPLYLVMTTIGVTRVRRSACGQAFPGDVRRDSKIVVSDGGEASINAQAHNSRPRNSPPHHTVTTRAETAASFDRTEV